MPRLVRRRPLIERVKAALNPLDYLLWLSEEIETREWNPKTVGTQLGVATNFIFLLARANSDTGRRADPVFDDGRSSSGWFAFIVAGLAWMLAALSCANAFYTMTRTRKYRLFEADVEKEQETPSAQRVRVQSSPATSSPLRILTDIMTGESAESRAHPDRTRDVWELAVWDPLPISLRIFCLFSPGHVLVYMMFLPLLPLDPRPSVTVFNCIVLQLILSTQLLFLQSRFSQQNKDTSIIQKEVMREYDIKFVHPRLYPTVRNAATQLSVDDFGNEQEFVEIGTPSTLIRRAFQTHPNPNYAKHVDPDNVGISRRSSSIMPAVASTPPANARPSPAVPSDFRPRPTPLRRSTPGLPTPMNPRAFQDSATSTSTSAGPGGFLGIYSHPSSPLKKTPSLGELQYRSPRNNSEMAQYEQYQAYKEREASASPVKSARKSTGSVPSLNAQAPVNPWLARPKPNYERYPKMWGQ